MNQQFRISGYLIIAMFLCLDLLVAQDPIILVNTRHRIGLNVGYGNQKIGGFEISPRHDYEILFFQIQYHYRLTQHKTWALDFLLLPQYNYSRYKYTIEFPKSFGHELGVSAGLQLSKEIIHNQMDGFLMAAFGPHFVSGVPERQAKGFIFSDTMAFGVIIKLKNTLFLNAKIGLRHISNAGIKEKNAGVDNLIFSTGILINIQKNTATPVNVSSN